MPRRNQFLPFRLVVVAAMLLVGLAWLPLPSSAVLATEQTPPLEELRQVEAKVRAITDKLVRCTVGVQIGAVRGSGVIVSEDGYVMTAGHVAGKPGQKVTFFLHDGRSIQGETLGIFKSVDAGLMKITNEGKWPFAARGPHDTPPAGDWCIALGHPLGYQPGRPPVVRVGRILVTHDEVLQTDCPLVGGDSGGPLFDLQGQVIGINSRIGGSTTMNFHVPTRLFLDNWDRLANGELWETQTPGRDSTELKSALQGVIDAVDECVVRVKCDGEDALLGTIVGPDGWIVTKASELNGVIACKLHDDRELPARIVGIHPAFDLAMLKVDASGLPEIAWSRRKPDVGQWVVAPGVADEPLALGVVSVPRRRIPPIAGVIGIALTSDSEVAEVEKVLPKSPADAAGLQPNDIITHLNGKPVVNPKSLVEKVRKHRPGEVVKLWVKRGDETLKIEVKLAKLNSPATRKREMQNALGVGVSKRRDDFPLVLQHDTVLHPDDCGGPLVDLDGKVVGVNIARGGRVETYCVPTDVLIGLMYDLMSGRLSPDRVKTAAKVAPVTAVPLDAAKPDAGKKAPEESPDKKTKKPEPAPQPSPQETPPPNEEPATKNEKEESSEQQTPTPKDSEPQADAS